MDHAMAVGLCRRANSIYRGLTHISMAGDQFMNDMRSAAAELVVAKYYNIYWSGATVPTETDVWKLQVRSTKYDDGELVVRPNDPKGIYVLVTGDFPNFTVRGFCTREFAENPKWWKNPHNYGHAWFVPQEELTPPWCLMEKLREELHSV